jgi:hypothetical protein
MKADINPQKPFVQVVTSGGSGCRFYRASMPAFCLNWFDGLGLHCVEVPSPLMEPGILNATRAIVLKSCAGWQGLELIKQLKAAQAKFGFRIVNDFDDNCFNDKDSVREGDSEFDAINTMQWDDRHNDTTIEALRLCDTVTVSKQYLADKFRRHGVENVTVIPNAVARSMWSLERREPLREDLKKVNLVLTACPQHAVPAHKDEKGNDVLEQLGDYASAEWREWVVKHVKDGDMTVTQMGNPSFLWNEIQDKVRSVPWVTPNRFASLVCRLKPDLVIAPLVPNEINRCRSDLRYVEAAVCSAAFLGSDFPDSPYKDTPEICRVPQGFTVEQLDERLRQIKDRDTFNKLVNQGWEFLVADGRIMESEKCVGRYVDAWGDSSSAIAFDLL